MQNVISLPAQRVPIYPTLDEPIPMIAAEPGFALLKSGTAGRLAETVSQSERDQVLKACRVIFASLTPAATIEIGVAMEELALHFPVLRRTTGENDIVVAHWVEDLGEYPIDLIREGCRQWRNGTKDKFPTPGQFKALIEPTFRHRQLLGRRAEDFARLTARRASA